MTRPNEHLSPIEKFAAGLRELQADAGSPSIREIEKGLRDSGSPYSRTAIHARLSGQTRADWEFVKALVILCTNRTEEKLATDSPVLAVWRLAHQEMLQQLAGERKREQYERDAKRDLAYIENQSEQGSSESPGIWRIPPRTETFVGQANLIRELETQAKAMPGSVVVLLDGMAGVGKTELAIQVAERLREEYEHHGYYINLHGYTPSSSPLRPIDAIGILLNMVGVPPTALPRSLPARTELWQSRVRNQKAIVILDNVADTKRVEALIPRSAQCFILLTSRNKLPALYDCKTVTVNALPPEDAAVLFRSLVRVPATESQTEVDRISYLCGYLPLAIKLAARQYMLAARRSLTDTASSLDDERSRLEWLSPERAGVSAAFHVSYKVLTPQQRWVFQCMGLHPGSVVSIDSLSNLAGVSDSAATARLRDLANLSLILPATRESESYHLHDLLKVFVKQRTDEEVPLRNQQQALNRLAMYYLTTARLADQAIGQVVAPDSEARLVPLERFDHQSDALRWIIEEQEAIKEFVRLRLLPELARITAPHLAEAGHMTSARALISTAINQYASASNATSLAECYMIRGRIEGLVDEFVAAEADYKDAVGIFRQLGDTHKLADAIDGLAIVYQQTSRFSLAKRHYQEALALYEQLGDMTGASYVLSGLGMVARQEGDYEVGVNHYKNAYSLFTSLGDQLKAARALLGLAGVERHMGLLDESRQHYLDAREDLAASLDQLNETNAIWGLGDVEVRAGNFAISKPYFRESLQRYRSLSSKIGEANALSSLGFVASTVGRTNEARDLHLQALELYHDVGDILGAAGAHEKIGLLDKQEGRLEQARERLAAALKIYRDLGVPHSDQIEIHLRSLD